MPRPVKVVEQPAFLIHFGHMETWTDYGNGFGDDRDVEVVKPNLAGKRPCRWIREGDCVCIDLHHVTCELCLKSKAARAEQAKWTKPEDKPRRMTAEGRLFWKSLDESVKRYRRETTPEQRFRNYYAMERGRRIRPVARIEGRGSSVKVVLG